MPEKLTLHKKLAQVMWEAERIPKNGRAPAAMGGFEFVQVGDAADAIRKALAEKSVSMIPTAIEVVGETEHATSSGKMMTTLTVRTTWTLTDGDSGETTVIQSLGSGADMGDKAAPKAQSNAMKYALLMGFLLSTGDDPEQTDTSDRQTAGTRPPPDRLPPREDHRAVDPPVVSEAYKETEELLGRERRTGIIRRSTNEHYKVEAREHPEGKVIGFRLEVGTDKNIPQCIIAGALGQAIHDATGADVGSLVGVRATVSGILYSVKNNKPDSRSWYRLHVDRIETTINGLEVVLPADTAEVAEPPADAHLFGETEVAGAA